MYTRRKFLRLSGLLTLFSYSFSAIACDIATLKTNAKKLFDFEGAVAKRLNFTAIAEKSTHVKYKKGNKCGKCSFFAINKAEGDFAPCSFASNRYVPACGWCQQFKNDPKKEG